MNLKSFTHSPKQFYFLSIAAGQFVLLTLVAMLLYAGGTNQEPTRAGYSFFRNFFSDLGLTVAHSGQANWAAAVLFTIALTTVGLSLILYCLAFTQFFSDRIAKTAVSLGALFGVIAGAGYITVAFTPANLFLSTHILAVQVAFTAYPVATLLFIIAILRTPSYPNRYAAIYALFAVFQIVYFWFLFYGPDVSTERGLIVQVTAQKVIAYASIITMVIQARGSWHIAKNQAEGSQTPVAIPQA